MAVLPGVLGRVATALLTTVVVSVVSFVLIRLLYPEAFGDPRPLFTEVAEFVEGLVVRLDLGISQYQSIPVTDLVLDGLPVDVMLFAGALVFGVAAGLLGGVVCARTRNGPVDRVLSGAALVVLSAPVYWLGLVAVMWFGRGTGSIATLEAIRTNAYVPPGEDLVGWIAAMGAPWVITGLPLAAFCLRLSRQALLETESEDYVRTAFGKGLRRRAVVYRHALPPSLPTSVSLAGAYAPLLVGNALLVEIVFNLPGVFRTFPEALETGDFPLIQGLIVLGALLVAAANLAADLVLAGLDPRTRPWAARS